MLLIFKKTTAAPVFTEIREPLCTMFTPYFSVPLCKPRTEALRCILGSPVRGSRRGFAVRFSAPLCKGSWQNRRF